MVSRQPGIGTHSFDYRQSSQGLHVQALGTSDSQIWGSTSQSQGPSWHQGERRAAQPQCHLGLGTPESGVAPWPLLCSPLE